MGLALGAQHVEHFVAVHFRHHDVEQQEVEVPLGQPRQGLAAVDGLHRVGDAQPLQAPHQQVAVLVHVVDDQRAGP